MIAAGVYVGDPDRRGNWPVYASSVPACGDFDPFFRIARRIASKLRVACWVVLGDGYRCRVDPR